MHFSALILVVLCASEHCVHKLRLQAFSKEVVNPLIAYISTHSHVHVHVHAHIHTRREVRFLGRSDSPSL